MIAIPGDVSSAMMTFDHSGVQTIVSTVSGLLDGDEQIGIDIVGNAGFEAR